MRRDCPHVRRLCAHRLQEHGSGYEQLQSGNGSERPSLDRQPFQLHHHTGSSFRFRNGEFTMIGLKVGEKPLLRAYSVASANYEENPGVLLDQSPRRPADLASSASEGRRPDHRQPQGHRHAGDRQPDQWPQSLSDRNRDRPRAVPERHQGPWRRMNVSRRLCCCTAAVMFANWLTAS